MARAGRRPAEVFPPGEHIAEERFARRLGFLDGRIPPAGIATRDRVIDSSSS